MKPSKTLRLKTITAEDAEHAETKLRVSHVQVVLGSALTLVVLLAYSGVAQAPASGSSAQAASTLAPGNVENGKVAFMAHQCFACHGYNGETGTRLIQEDGTFIPRLLTVRGFISFLRAPRPTEAPPVGSSLAMPSYGVTSMSDQKAADLFAYIKTFKPTQPALKDIPLLSEMARDGGKLKK